jgi:sugar lactone lactonase YvrE
MTPLLIFDAQAELGESPVWSETEQRLYWIDINGKRLHRFDPIAKQDEHFPLASLTGCLAPCRNGHWLLAAQSGIEEVRLSGSTVKVMQTLARPEENKPENRYNDGKCSPEGRFWFGSLNMHHQPYQASLYVLDAAGCRTVLTGATNSNGLGWSPDGSEFYWIDTPTRKIEAFSYNTRYGTLSQRRTAVQFTEDLSSGRPDGMTVDSAGMIWAAHWDGGRITRWNPRNGECLQTAELPVRNVTSLTFGGRNYETLFITTARREGEPLSGGLWAFQPEICGMPVSLYDPAAV